MYTKEYFNSETTKAVGFFPKYLEFLGALGINLQGKRVLDIGCATGGFIACVFAASTCYGCDISSYAITECQERFPAIKDHFFVNDINQQAIEPTETFDCITLFDVIEHLTNFEHLEETISKNLSEDGVVVITTPNANSLTRLARMKNFTGEVDATHRMLFSPYTLDFFLRRIGLRKRVNFTPYAFYFEMNILTKYLRFGGQIVAVYERA